MRSRWIRRLAAGLTVALAMLVAPAQAADEVYVENVTAAAEVTLSTCPWGPPSEVGIICTDTYLLYFQARHAGGTGPTPPWTLYIFETTWLAVGGEEEYEQIGERDGIAPAPDGYVDAEHMRTAAVRGSVPMSEGDPIAVDLQWDLSDAEIQVSGNNGPIGGFSWGLHGRDGCAVANLLAHQRWRWDFDGIAGTLGGVDIEDLYLPDFYPHVFIEGRSTFKVILNQTGVNCTLA